MSLKLLLPMYVMILGWQRVQPDDVSSALSDLEPLLETQKQMISTLEAIVHKKRRVLSFLQRELKRYVVEHKKSSKSIRYYLGNPISSYTFMKRLSADLEFIEDVINERFGWRKIKNLTYPSNQDFDEAVRGIFRLHVVFRLNVTQLADGILNTTFSKSGELYSERFQPMTSLDCYDIGQSLSSRKLHKFAVPWFLEAHRLFENGLQVVSKINIVHAIRKEYNTLDENEKFIEWTEKLIEMKPNMDIDELKVLIDIHRMRLGKKKYREELNRQLSETNKRKKSKRRPLIRPEEEIRHCGAGPLSNGYKRLCRNEMNVGSYIAKRLKCWYSSGYHPFIRLAKIKTEQLYVKPDIYLFYNMLHDKEVDAIKDYVLPRMQSSRTGIGPIDYTSFRTSKVGLMNATFGIANKIDQRIADVSGLNVKNSPYHQVQNYGVWGYYSQHRDYFDRPHINYGNRIATALLYMKDLELGGATVFTALGLTVFPVKGAMLFWYNLLPSGLGDNVTCHAACPVLRGSKWLVTKWVSSRNQELYRPCTTQFQSRRPRDIPYPEPKKIK